MKRFNAFLMIHKALRSMMYNVSMSLQHTDFANAKELPHSLERLAEVLDIFDAHAGHEDNYLFCMLETCDPVLQEEMEKEHVVDHALTAELRKLIVQYQSSTDAAEKGALGSSICYTFNEFVAFNLTHLNKEEMIVNASLWKHYTDLDIMQANFRMINSLSPEEIRRNAIWMMRACNDPEIIGWMGVVKKQSPEPVMNLLLGIAREELPEHRYVAVQQSIMEMV